VYACDIGNVELVKYLVEKGANVNHIIKAGHSLLILSSKDENIEIINILLSSGADINYKNKTGDTFFTYVCKHNYMILFNCSLVKDMDINAENGYGHTGLIYMCMVGNIENVKLLIKIGVNVNHINKHGDTALTFACVAGHIDIVKLLLANGAIISDKIDYNTMFILTYHNKYKDIIKYLTAAGYDYSKLCNTSKFTKRITLCLYDYNEFMHECSNFEEVVIFSEDRFMNDIEYTACRNNIISEINAYMKSDEYNFLRKEFFEPISSHIFSYIVLVSDNYYSISEK